MPTYDAFCRVPLVNPAYVALPDGAVHIEGTLNRLMQRALQNVAPAGLSPLDAVMATKLGEYSELPPMPDLEGLAAALPADAQAFVESARAGLMIAAAGKDKDAMLRVLTAMRAFTDALPSISEETLFPVGADALRVAAELYRRTGQRFLLTLMERLRAQLPDVSGMFHSFPFLKAYVPENVSESASDETSQYYRRMKLLGTGAMTADALAITAALALYSGSARDAGASKAGVAALQRYHGMPNGAFSADPYLAGRDPSRSTDLTAICAQTEALADLLAASGDLSFADRLERLIENALSNAVVDGGVRASQAINRIAGEASGRVAPADRAQTSALLRACYAIRRSVWMVKSESELSLLLPYDGVCLTRMDGVPVRVSAKVSDFKKVTLTVEAKQPAEFTLSLRVPDYAEGATVSVNGAKAQEAPFGKLLAIKRMFKTGDTVELTLPCEPFVETGYRGSAAVYCGAMLMALPLPAQDAAWQYALDSETPLSMEIVDGQPRAHVDACDAPEWTAQNGRIAPPPQGLRMGAGYELTLLPYADTIGRIATFPQAAHRE